MAQEHCVPFEDFNEEDSNESDGFLDPLFYAASGLERLCALTKTRPVHLALVSPTALRALIVEGQGCQRLYLNDLGLTDSHVLAIVDGLSIPGTHLEYLNLESNLGITVPHYGARFDLINRANVVGYLNICDGWRGFCVHDKAWEGELNLVSEMNLRYVVWSI
jgi:hypothetical protein